MLAAVFQICAFYSPCTGVHLGGKGSSLSGQCALQESSPKERVETAHKATWALSLGGVGHIAQHTWEGDPAAWGQ